MLPTFVKADSYPLYDSDKLKNKPISHLNKSFANNGHQFSPLKKSEKVSVSLRDIKAYKVRNKLGQGAIGSVNFVLHKERKEVYALKQVPYHTNVSDNFCGVQDIDLLL